MTQPQYSYGYGYQAYGYAQPAAMNYMQYPQQAMPYVTAQTVAQQPSVGYTPYTAVQQPPVPAKTTPQPPLPPPPGTSQTSYYAAIPPPPQQQQVSSSIQQTPQLVGGQQTTTMAPQTYATPVKPPQQPGYYSYQQYTPASTQSPQQQAAAAAAAAAAVYSSYYSSAYRPPAPASQNTGTTYQQSVMTSTVTATIPYSSYSQSTPTVPYSSYSQSTPTIPHPSYSQSTPTTPYSSYSQSTPTVPYSSYSQSTPTTPYSSYSQSTPTTPYSSYSQSTPTTPYSSYSQSTPTVPYSSYSQSTPYSSYSQSTPTTPYSSYSQRTPTISYPSYSQSNYSSAANSYYKQMKTQQQGFNNTSTNKPKPLMVGIGGGGGMPSQSSLTPQQKQVVQHYIQQKTNIQTPGIGKKLYRPPTQQQMFYCDVCRISCASAATYKTHLDGKNHKKKLAQQKNIAEESRTGDCYCQLCDVVCSNNDSLAAHVRGVKHQKVVTLHRRLGKPVPNIKITNSTASKAVANVAQKENGKGVFITAPRITFVGGQKLSSTGSMSDEKQPLKVYPPTAPPQSSSSEPSSGGAKIKPLMPEGNGGVSTVTTPTQSTSNDAGSVEGEMESVGEHLVIMVKGDPKFPHATYKCQMCDCYFNDDYAKKAHVKGRRHRLNYKKMYQPDLYIEPTKQQKKTTVGGSVRGGRRSWGSGPIPPHMNQGGEPHPPEHWQETEFGDYGYPPHFHFHHPHDMGMEEWGWDMMQPVTFHNPRDDRLVLSKHSTIFPQDIELKSVDMAVEDVERALKLVSDGMLAEKVDAEFTTSNNEQFRELKGVMRVGGYARGVMLRGDCSVQLVLMCANKPTLSFFNTVASQFQKKLEEFKTAGDTDNTYNVTPEVDKSLMIVITQVGDYRVQVTVTFTSIKMRGEPSKEEIIADKESGVLNRANCLAALAALRHTKWFQAMCHGLPSFTIVLRVMKDICRRVPAWGVLNSWMLELLVQKCIASANPDYLRPGDVFRRIMECVASGLFLPGNTGLFDPCEKGVIDVASVLSAQERANITLSAQHALRLIAFDKLHLVLGVNPLPTPGASKQPPSGTPGVSESETDRTPSGGGTKREVENGNEGLEESKKIKLD